MKRKAMAFVMIAAIAASAITSSTFTAFAAEGEATAADALLDGKVVVYVANECASDWQAISTNYLQALVEEAGGECRIYNPENDASTQAQMVEDALVLNPDVLVIKPIDQAAIIPALQQVNAAGVPIITLDTGIIEDADVDIMCSIQTDQTSLGSTAAEYVKKLAEESGETAKVVTVLGDMSSNIAQYRQSGFNDVADATDQIEVLAETESKWDPSTAYTAVMDMMTANPDANTIFCCADCMMSGVIQALDEMGRLAPVGDENHVTIVGIDSDPNGCSYVEQGYVDQESEHNSALHSDIAFKVIVDYVNGYEIPETIFFDTTARTIDNIADAWGNMDVADVDNWGWMDQDVYTLQTPVE
jgi:ABC-type sugar transport system substrate-binding protein